MRPALFQIAAFVAMWSVAAHASAALAVVLAIDVSASVDADSFVLQRDGIARAFESRRLADALAALPDGTEALFLEWSDPAAIAIAVDWQRVVGGKSAAVFAAAVHAAPRASHGLTAIGPALLAAARQFDRLPEKPARRVIDISGDGMANLGLPPAAARDRIVRAGITINGLAILADEPWLESYYRDEVIGGPGAFVLAAQSDASFAKAMLRKLVQEVAGGSSGGPPGHLAQMQ
jgi:Protein of unknown function (DUF1194)